MKRTSAKVLMSILVILTMIPFSFTKVNADSGDLHKVYSITIEGSLRYDYIDYYYVSNSADSTTFTLTVNNGFVFNASNVSSYGFGLVDSDGGAEIIDTTYSYSGTGSTRAAKVTYVIEMKNCSYWHGRLFLKTDTSWYPVSDSRTLTGKYGLVETFTSFTVSGGDMNGSNYYLRSILTALQNGSGTGGGTVDLSTVETFLSDILVNLDIQLAYQYDINTKMDIIINQLQAQTGSPAGDAVDNNDQMNEDTTEIINDYISLESTFTSDFTDSQEELTTVLQNTNLTQFSNALIWFTTQLTGIYNSLGDMKILVQLPLILGIALFIIGRGAVIFREPVTERETTTINETWKNGKYVGTTKTHSYSATQGKRRAKK